MAPADPNPPKQQTGDKTAMAEKPATDQQNARKDKAAMRDEAAMTDQGMQEPAPDPTAMTNDQTGTFDPGTISANDLIDTTVYSADGENVGEISDVLLADSGEIDAVVIDVGGFLGIGEKPVAISYDDLNIQVDENQDLILQTAFTRDQLDAAPEYDETAFRDNPESVLVHG